MTKARKFYISVEVDFFDHGKTTEVGEAVAFRHLRAMAWCHRHRTDGFLPRGSALAIVYSEATAKKLQKAGLWDRARGGWRIHDYLEHQPSKADLEASAEAGRIAAVERWARQKGGAGNA